MNRSHNLLVALFLAATQFLTLPIQADEPTPARRPSTRNTAERDGRSVVANSKPRNASSGQAVSTRRPSAGSTANSKGKLDIESNQSQVVGSGVSRTAERQPVRKSSQGNVQQASATNRRGAGNSITQASHTMANQSFEPALESGEYIVDEGSGFVDSGSSCDTCGSGMCGGGCDGLACGSPSRTNWGFDLCNPGRGGKQLCICLPSHGWVQMDYLLFTQQGMNIPPLLTTQPNSTTTPTTILGNQDILKDRLNGGRIRFGWWFANNPNLGIEGEYIGLGQSNFDYRNQAIGTPILARPFFNVLTGNEDSELVSNTNLNGRFQFNAFSKFDGAAVRFRRSLCCSSSCCYSPVACGPVPTQSRIDATLGWRFFQLKEGLTANENLLQTVAPNTTYDITDSFKTRNQFNGVELGVLWQGRRGYWSLDTLMRCSIGNNHQTVSIAGSTLINGVTPTGPAGGFLAQQSNIGTYTQDSLAVIPEFGANLGYQLTPRWRANAGYNFIYWSSVVRPGDQIDTDLNPNLIPPSTAPITGANRPRFTLRESDYWVQGLNLGLEYRW